MTTLQQNVQQSQANLKEARQQKSGLQRKLDTLKVKDGASAHEIERIEKQLNVYSRETIPVLRACLAHDQAQLTIVTLLGGEIAIKTEDEIRAEAAAVAHEQRTKLQQVHLDHQRNSALVAELIEALHQGYDKEAHEDISFPNATEVVIHGQKYSTNGGADLRFLAGRAVNLAWPA